MILLPICMILSSFFLYKIFCRPKDYGDAGPLIGFGIFLEGMISLLWCLPLLLTWLVYFAVMYFSGN